MYIYTCYYVFIGERKVERASLSQQLHYPSLFSIYSYSTLIHECCFICSYSYYIISIYIYIFITLCINYFSLVHLHMSSWAIHIIVRLMKGTKRKIYTYVHVHKYVFEPTLVAMKNIICIYIYSTECRLIVTCNNIGRSGFN